MKKTVFELLDRYNGTLSMKDAREHGVSPVTIKRMVDKGELDREYPGFYTLPGQFADELFIVQRQFEMGIISHYTALDLYDLTDFIPRKIDLTFPYGYHISKKSIDNFAVSVHFTKQENYQLGITTTKSQFGNLVKAYDRERTLCDIWNPWTKADMEIKIKALQVYAESEFRNFRKLQEYRKQLPTTKEMGPYLMALM